MAGHGGGAWKVAYADFVTAMMAFFLVMWISAQSAPVKKAVAEYFEDPLGLDKGARSTSFWGPEDSNTVGMWESGRGMGRGMAMATRKVEGRVNMAGVAAKRPPRMTIFRHFTRSISIGTAIPFDEDSADLNDEAVKQLDDLVPILLGKLNKVEIRVYTQRRPLPKECAFKNPMQLSAARGVVTMNFLVEHDIPASRIRISQDGEYESNSLFADSGIKIPESRVEVYSLDEFAERRLPIDESEFKSIFDPKSAPEAAPQAQPQPAGEPAPEPAAHKQPESEAAPAPTDDSKASTQPSPEADQKHDAGDAGNP